MLASRRGSRTGPGRTTVLSAARALWPPPATATLDRSADHPAVEGRCSSYTVVPSLRHPRYLVPRASQAAIALRPTQGGLKGLRMQGLSVLQRWSLLHRLPGARLHVETSPGVAGIEDLLGSVLGEVAHVVVRLGRPRPHRTLVVWVFGPAGAPLAIAKVSRGEEAQAAMETEYAALAREPARDVPGLVAPRALAYLRWQDSDVLVISALVSAGGRPVHDPPVPQMRALAAGAGADERPLRDSAFAARLTREIDALVPGEDRDWLAAALRVLVDDLGGTVVRTGAWHGDWVSWNQSVDGATVLLWDWEHYTTTALAGFDHVHFLAQEQRARGTDDRSEDAWLSRADAALRDDWGQAPGQRLAVLRGYLLEVNLRFVRDRQLEDAASGRAGWSRDLVERLADRR